MSRGDVTEALPEVSSDFVPEIRLIVFTDTHNENENVADAIDTAYAMFDDDTVYKGIDGFFGLGDFSSIGTEPDYKAYTDTLKEHIREETVCIFCLSRSLSSILLPVFILSSATCLQISIRFSKSSTILLSISSSLARNSAKSIYILHFPFLLYQLIVSQKYSS